MTDLMTDDRLNYPFNCGCATW